MDNVDEDMTDFKNKPLQFETAVVSEEKKLAGAKEKDESSRTSKKKVVGEVMEDGTFAIKLKKTEKVKRKIEEDKMEEVKLKHHEFENAPLTPSDEGLTNVVMSKPISIKTDEPDTKASAKKKTITKKIKSSDKPEESDSVSPPLSVADIPSKKKPNKELEI